MLLGYARNAAEEKMLIAAGIPASRIYLEGRRAESVDKIRARPGDEVATVHGLRALGNSRRAILANLGHIHAMGAVVMDIETEDKSGPGRGAEMLNRALSRIHGEEAIANRAHEMQRAQAIAKSRRRLAATKAERVWRDKTLSNKEALAKMWGWSQNVAYSHFKARGLPIGRRGKK